MPVRSSYPVGMPCWIDCITCDLAATKDFYYALFGWTFDDEGGGYHIVRHRGEIVGGLGAAPPGREHTSFWTTYLATKDLDLTVAAVRENGGQVVMPPVAAGANGRLCLGLDPSGAAVGFWQGSRTEGVVLTDEDGAMVWHELCTPSAAILAFYRRLFDLEAVPDDAAVLVRLDGTPAFSIRETADAAPRWIPYFGASSVPEVSSRAADLGAELVPGAGGDGSALVRDPSGATFALRGLRDR